MGSSLYPYIPCWKISDQKKEKKYIYILSREKASRWITRFFIFLKRSLFFESRTISQIRKLFENFRPSNHVLGRPREQTFFFFKKKLSIFSSKHYYT